MRDGSFTPPDSSSLAEGRGLVSVVEALGWSWGSCSSQRRELVKESAELAASLSLEGRRTPPALLSLADWLMPAIRRSC